MFGIIRAWRRRRLARRPFPEEWLAILRESVPFYGKLSPELQAAFRDRLKVFVWEKHFAAAGGLALTDEMRVVIGAAAVRIVLHLDLSYYDRLTEIVVYPSHYRHPEGDGPVFGEAHSFGTVVLSWDAVQHGLADPLDGQDTASHEFAHVLDQADGAFDGTPELRRFADYRPWAMVLGEHYRRLQKRDRSARRVLRSYGATNEAEFFAVATESFFEKPQQMQKQTPELYEELKRFYGWDPAAGR